MMVPGAFQVIVVDLHMPRMPGTDFCRAVRLRDCQAQGGGGGVAGAGEMAGVPPADCTKLLLHTTAAGSVKSDDLEVGGVFHFPAVLPRIFSTETTAASGQTENLVKTNHDRVHRFPVLYLVLFIIILAIRPCASMRFNAHH